MQALQIYTETSAEARRIEKDLITCRDLDVRDDGYYFFQYII